MVYFQSAVISLSLPGRIKGKTKVTRNQVCFLTSKKNLLVSLCRNLVQYRFTQIFPSPKCFHPSLEFPVQELTFPVSTYSARPICEHKIYPHHCKSMHKCSKKGSTSKQTVTGWGDETGHPIKNTADQCFVCNFSFDSSKASSLSPTLLVHVE